MGQLTGHGVLLPDYRTVSTARIGSEWVYSIDNNRTVFTVLALNDGGATYRYVGPRYVPIPKKVKMGTFTETFGTVSNCYRGQLITRGRLSAQHVNRILRTNGIDRNLTKTEQCEALERLGEFVWP